MECFKKINVVGFRMFLVQPKSMPSTDEVGDDEVQDFEFSSDDDDDDAGDDDDADGGDD
jgi:hypothetical protein